MTNDFSNPILRLAIVSDLHAFVSEKKASDSVIDLSSANRGRSNPLSDLSELIKTRNIEVDALVCAGDICNKADFHGLERAWTVLHEIKSDLKAKHLLATCGNHDLDSRYLDDQPDPDPKGGILSLIPSFPFDDEALNDRFWARNYALFKIENDVVVLALNTCAFHGGKPEEIDHGRVSQRTIDSIERELKAFHGSSAYILLCHHHPLPLQGWKDRDDGEFMKKGQVLLDVLTKKTGTCWLVVHGHRHFPRLIHGASSSNEIPIIFGSSSLGARIAGVPNQCHFMDLFASSAPDHSPIVGTVRTFSWTESAKWVSSNSASGLPPTCGFGYRGQLGALTSQIDKLVGAGFMKWEVLQDSLPSIKFLMPDSMRQLSESLQQVGIEILSGRDGHPAQVGR